jgi:hypothetical protein
MAEMDTGYIKLWRKSMDSAVWQCPDLWRTWTCCLMLANHREAFVKIDRLTVPIKIKAGQFITGRFEFHQAMYPQRKKNNKSPITVWRWLQCLEKLQNLNIETNKRFSIITIVNWDSYQGNGFINDHLNEPQAINRRSTDDQQTITNKNDKNVKNEKKTTIAEKFDPVLYRPSFIPESLWLAFLDNRKFKKLQNSEVALKVICKQFGLAIDAGYPIDDCIGAYVSSGWQTFKPEYMANRAGGRKLHQDKPQSLKERHALALLEVDK